MWIDWSTERKLKGKTRSTIHEGVVCSIGSIEKRAAGLHICKLSGVYSILAGIDLQLTSRNDLGPQISSCWSVDGNLPKYDSDQQAKKILDRKGSERVWKIKGPRHFVTGNFKSQSAPDEFEMKMEENKLAKDKTKPLQNFNDQSMNDVNLKGVLCQESRYTAEPQFIESTLRAREGGTQRRATPGVFTDFPDWRKSSNGQCCSSSLEEPDEVHINSGCTRGSRFTEVVFAPIIAVAEMMIEENRIDTPDHNSSSKEALNCLEQEVQSNTKKRKITGGFEYAGRQVVRTNDSQSCDVNCSLDEKSDRMGTPFQSCPQTTLLSGETEDAEVESECAQSTSDLNIIGGREKHEKAAVHTFIASENCNVNGSTKTSEHSASPAKQEHGSELQQKVASPGICDMQQENGENWTQVDTGPVRCLSVSTCTLRENREGCGISQEIYIHDCHQSTQDMLYDKIGDQIEDAEPSPRVSSRLGRKQSDEEVSVSVQAQAENPIHFTRTPRNYFQEEVRRVAALRAQKAGFLSRKLTCDSRETLSQSPAQLCREGSQEFVGKETFEVEIEERMDLNFASSVRSWHPQFPSYHESSIEDFCYLENTGDKSLFVSRGAATELAWTQPQLEEALQEDQTLPTNESSRPGTKARTRDTGCDPCHSRQGKELIREAVMLSKSTRKSKNLRAWRDSFFGKRKICPQSNLQSSRLKPTFARQRLTSRSSNSHSILKITAAGSFSKNHEVSEALRDGSLHISPMLASERRFLSNSTPLDIVMSSAKVLCVKGEKVVIGSLHQDHQVVKHLSKRITTVSKRKRTNESLLTASKQDCGLLSPSIHPDRMEDCFECKGSLTSGESVACSRNDCDCIYHLGCMAGLPDVSWDCKGKLVCPQHVCYACGCIGGSMLWRCQKCSVATHEECIPCPDVTTLFRDRPGWAICWRHSREVEYKLKPPTRDSQEIFRRLPVPSEQQEFSLSTEFIKEVMENDKEPPPYFLIRRNVFLIKKKRDDADDGVGCCCKSTQDECGDDCECRVQSMSCSKDCKCSEKCCNKPFRKDKRLRVVKTEHCGWGAITAEAIRKDEFVIEYTGEVIDDAMCEKRLWEMKGRRSICNFYMCEIAKDFIIDATRKGNASRYLNHSCQPNCRLEKWRVDGETRVGVFAGRDIIAGEELTYDYKYVEFGPNVKCCCGAPKCRGAIGERFNSTRKSSIPDLPVKWGWQKKRSSLSSL